jgi:uncharacterized membrane protein YeiH
MHSLNYFIGMTAMAAFAMAGVLAAARKDMDIVSLTVLGVVTAVGGGTLRDLLMSTEVFWMVDFNGVWVAIAASICAFYLERHLRDESVWTLILYLDAFGLALFGVQSIDKALALQFAAPVAVVMATITGIGGGLIRDVLTQRPNLLLSREIYATAIIAGSIFYVALLGLTGKTTVATLAGFAFTFIFRALAIYRHWRMPKWMILRSNLNG